MDKYDESVKVQVYDASKEELLQEIGYPLRSLNKIQITKLAVKEKKEITIK